VVDLVGAVLRILGDRTGARGGQQPATSTPTFSPPTRSTAPSDPLIVVPHRTLSAMDTILIRTR